MPPPTWSGDFEATNGIIACPQPNFPASVMTEDCLIVNVFTPNTNKTNLPVMVWIHGGGFTNGLGWETNYEWLIHEGLIVVNFNYRLGPLGFLCLGTKDIPGNAGLKDQVAALRWIKCNIAKFGGNPEDVTVAGYSAGSASVEHLMLSPMAKGLFNKIICHSGSALSPWAITIDPIATAKRYMKGISGNCSDDINEIEEFFKSLSTEQLVGTLYQTDPNSSFGSVVCVETPIEGEESFYTKPPYEILKCGEYNKKVKLLTGTASDEGLLRQYLYPTWKVQMEANISDFFPQDLFFGNDTEKEIAAAKVDAFYFKNSANITLREYTDFESYTMFGYSNTKSAKLHAGNGVRVYLYYYTYILSSAPYDVELRGNGHGYEGVMVYESNIYPPFIFNEDDSLLSKRMIKMWTHFAKHGTPMSSTSELLPVKWKRVDPEKLNYMRLDQTLAMKHHLLGDSFEFWDPIYECHRREPKPPQPDSSPLCIDI